MSLNWREIDEIIGELSLENGFVQNIVQPDFTSLLLETFTPGKGRASLYVSLKPGKTRLHGISFPIRRRVKLQRFSQLLRARLKGSRIVSIEQIPGQRLVELTLLQGEDTTRLWLRLWGNAANIILCDQSGTIIDAFYRRPARGEVSGGRFLPRETEYPAPDEEFRLRDVPAGYSYNRFIEEQYLRLESEQELKSRQGNLTRRWMRHLAQLEGRLGDAERAIRTTEADMAQRETGDLILANLHRMTKGDTEVEVEDYNQNEKRIISLDPRLTPQENAERYYQRQKRKTRKRIRAEEELADLTAEIERARGILYKLESASNLDELDRLPAPPTSKKDRLKGADTTLPGTAFYSGPWQIIVGRNAKESDHILRGWARGNDYWIHARDYPGGHIFIRSRKGKSVPLEVLLDAGNLAVYYSKGKQNGKGDCYYTQVKYLRRPRGGKTGTVLPTQEKNLAIELEPDRLERLLGRNEH